MSEDSKAERNDTDWCDAVPDPKIWQHAAEILNNMRTSGKRLALTAEDVRWACAFAEFELDGRLKRIEPEPDGTYRWERRQ